MQYLREGADRTMVEIPDWMKDLLPLYIGHKRDKAWRAQLKYQNKQITLGNFPTREKASRAVDARLKQLFGEFAHLNKQRG